MPQRFSGHREWHPQLLIKRSVELVWLVETINEDFVMFNRAGRHFSYQSSSSRLQEGVIVIAFVSLTLCSRMKGACTLLLVFFVFT
mmetsp:Transcript_17738/g.53554  ORF Transcript_17738/g.53554 Transcript_17738/m.53554 type:complete len:86 (+) Transcript_17738:869-1126(+)